MARVSVSKHIVQHSYLSMRTENDVTNRDFEMLICKKKHEENNKHIYI